MPLSTNSGVMQQLQAFSRMPSHIVISCHVIDSTWTDDPLRDSPVQFVRTAWVLRYVKREAVASRQPSQPAMRRWLQPADWRQQLVCVLRDSDLPRTRARGERPVMPFYFQELQYRLLPHPATFLRRAEPFPRALGWTLAWDWQQDYEGYSWADLCLRLTPRLPSLPLLELIERRLGVLITIDDELSDALPCPVRNQLTC